MTRLASELRRQVAARAGFRCEYCRTSQRVIGMPLVLDHILPRVAGGLSLIHIFLSAEGSRMSF